MFDKHFTREQSVALMEEVLKVHLAVGVSKSFGRMYCLRYMTYPLECAVKSTDMIAYRCQPDKLDSIFSAYHGLRLAEMEDGRSVWLADGNVDGSYWALVVDSYYKNEQGRHVLVGAKEVSAEEIVDLGVDPRQVANSLARWAERLLGHHRRGLLDFALLVGALSGLSYRAVGPKSIGELLCTPSGDVDEPGG